jgi:hypothetical protein
MAKPTAPSPALPDFDLAEARGFDPSALDTRLPLVRFILVLAGAFNDMKGVIYAAARLQEVAPIAREKVSWTGQLAGMQIQTIRLLAGILHELMNMIDKEGAVVDSSEFNAIVARLPAPQRRAWTQVARIARREDGAPTAASSGSHLLCLIRNNLAFHYGTKVIAKGYGEFFADPTLKFRDKAVVSDGRNMEETRFYFADAAMEQGLKSLTGLSLHDLQGRLNSVGEAMNLALKHIVMAYIAKVATPSRYVLRT